MVHLCTSIPAGRYALVPVLNGQMESCPIEGLSNAAVIAEPINEVYGDPRIGFDEKEEPTEVIDLDLDSAPSGQIYEATTSAGRKMNILLLNASESCDHPFEMESWPCDQSVSFDTPYGPLTVAESYALIPVESDVTNPDDGERGTHNWLVFNLAETTQVILDNGAIVIGDRELELLDLCRQPYAGAPV